MRGYIGEEAEDDDPFTQANHIAAHQIEHDEEEDARDLIKDCFAGLPHELQEMLH